MKILHLIFSFQVGGAETMLVDIINQQAKQHTVCLCIINNRYNEQLIDGINKKVRIILINRKEQSRNIIDVIRLNFLLYTYRPSVIHCHDSNIINYIAFKSQFNTVLTVHGTALPLNGIKYYKKIVAISQAVGDVISQKGIAYYIIHNGIDINTISNKNEIFHVGDTLRLVQIGRLAHLEKGQDLALEALFLIKKWYPSLNINLDFIGAGDSKDFLLQRTKALGLEHNVNFLGLCSRTYIYSHLKTYDILLQPSLSEGFGLTIAEGMIAGLPVLVSNIEGPMEVVKKGKLGFIFCAGDTNDMAKKLEYIIQHESETNEISKKAQLYALENYALLTMVDKYEKLYTTF